MMKFSIVNLLITIYFSISTHDFKEIQTFCKYIYIINLFVF